MTDLSPEGKKPWPPAGFTEEADDSVHDFILAEYRAMGIPVPDSVEKADKGVADDSPRPFSGNSLSDLEKKDQPREPKGVSTGGQFKSTGGWPTSESEVSIEDRSGGGVHKKYSEAIEGYVQMGEVAEYVNGSLRRDEGFDPRPEADALFETAEDLDKAMSRSSFAESGTVYRGLPGRMGPILDQRIKDKKHIIDHGFQSTSTKFDIAASFAERNNGSSAVLAIEVPRGTPALDLRRVNRMEKEILLDRQTPYKITGKETWTSPDGKRTVTVYKAKASRVWYAKKPLERKEGAQPWVDPFEEDYIDDGT